MDPNIDYCCPNCGGEVVQRETAQGGIMWFCKQEKVQYCRFCTSFESELKRKSNIPTVQIKQMTEESRRILANILVM